MTQNTSPSPGKGKPPPSMGDSPGESSTTKRNNKTKTMKGTKTKPNKNQNKVTAFIGACHEAEFKIANAVATQFNKSSGVIKLEKAARAFCDRKLMPRLSAAIESKKPLDVDDFVKGEINWKKFGRKEQQNGVTVTVVTNTLAEGTEKI